MHSAEIGGQSGSRDVKSSGMSMMALFGSTIAVFGAEHIRAFGVNNQ
jgi:hypothetical protein